MAVKRDKSSPWEFLWYALYAFAGLGLELVLMGGVEPALFGGAPPSRYTAAHTLLHWGMTMACWGLTAALLVRQAEKKLGFSLLEARPVPRKGAGLAIGLAALCILLNALDWGTLKVIGEFQKKGPLLFAGQYLYYAFEVVLVLLIAAFGQRFWEALRKGRSQFPFGGVVLCYIWSMIFDGILRNYSPYLTANATYGFWGLVILVAWQQIGYMMIIYVAGLQSVPGDLIEAAKIDGANDREILFKIKIPMVMPSVTICTFLTLTNSFKLFDQNVALTAGEPANASEMLALNIYNTFYGRSGAQWKGIGQAKAVVFFLIVVVISLIQLHFTRSKEVQQ